jgi:two-component system sensor histidine kinase DegS
MVASPDNSEATSVDALRAILREAAKEFTALEAKLAQLSDRVTAVLTGAETDRGSIQQFIDAFALEQDIQRKRPVRAEGGLGALFDFEHIQRERRELERRVVRSRALRTNLEAALQVVRSCKEQFAEERAFQAPENATDVRLQQAMNSAREEERRRLAREIHDGPAQVLANAIFVVGIGEQVVKREPDKVSEQLSDLKALLKDGVAEIRRFMFDLRPSMLEDQGLAPTLRYYVTEYNRMFAKRVELTTPEHLPTLNDDEELCVFRIVQEALQNIQKHAETDEASIALQLDDQGRRLELTVADGGRGFTPSQTAPRQGQGAGLPGMRERARLIGAELTVESSPGEGTTLRLLIPLRGSTSSLGGRLPGAVE